MQIATASCCMLRLSNGPTAKSRGAERKNTRAKPKVQMCGTWPYLCASRHDETLCGGSTQHQQRAFIPALSTLRFVLLRVVSLCACVCVCLWVWSTFLAQVISAHFMLKSEKPSSASGSERRLGGTHMFSFCGVLVERASSSLLLLLLRCTPEWVKRAWGRQRNCPRLGSRREPNTHIADTLRRSVTWPERSRFN